MQFRDSTVTTLHHGVSNSLQLHAGSELQSTTAKFHANPNTPGLDYTLGHTIECLTFGNFKFHLEEQG